MNVFSLNFLTLFKIHSLELYRDVLFMPKAFLVGSEVAKRKLESLGYQPSIADANIGPRGNVQSLSLLMHFFCIVIFMKWTVSKKQFLFLNAFLPIWIMWCGTWKQEESPELVWGGNGIIVQTWLMYIWLWWIFCIKCKWVMAENKVQIEISPENVT